jgi:hypothetical protein
MKCTWYDTIRKVTAQDQLDCQTVQEGCHSENKSQWQIHSEILYCRGKRDADYIDIPPTTQSNGINIKNGIMCLIYQELAHIGPNKCYQYAKVYYFWYLICQYFVNFCHRYHLCQVSKIPTQVSEGKQRLMPIQKKPFGFIALGFAGLLPRNCNRWSKDELRYVMCKGRRLGLGQEFGLGQGCKVLE